MRRSLRKSLSVGAYPVKLVLFVLFALAALTGVATVLSVPMRGFASKEAVPAGE
jgi:TRAP-type mannitol/chloroaromatic compound transport system permease small subunit